jgi:tetratricopeptide (TPR) repeat protein
MGLFKTESLFIPRRKRLGYPKVTFEIGPRFQIKHVGSVRTVKMRLFHFLLLLTLSILAGATWLGSTGIYSSRAQSAFEKREAAYRANNIGVALLEQYKTKDAVDSFTRALETKPDLLIARINLAIALYYLPDPEAARREAEKVLKQDASAPQPHYIQGLIARAQNRFDDAVSRIPSRSEDRPV